MVAKRIELKVRHLRTGKVFDAIKMVDNNRSRVDKVHHETLVLTDNVNGVYRRISWRNHDFIEVK